MNRIAIVGYGFMGRTHYGAWRKCRGARVVAVCTRDLSRLTARVTGNIKGAADNTSIPESVRKYDDFDRMLADGGFDIVDITVPTQLHPQMAIAALDAGYHVFCEKPMALSLKGCDRMLAAAKRTGRRLLVAHCVRFFPENLVLAEIIRSGRYGKVIAADFARYLAAPKWGPNADSWLLDESKSGGLYVDTHIHDADYIVSVLGMPVAVDSRAHRSDLGYVDHTVTRYEYEDDRVITCQSSFDAADSLMWDPSARVFFEKATVFVGKSYANMVTIYPHGGKPFSPKLPKLSAYDAEVRYFLRLVENGVDKDSFLTAEDARESVRLVLAERRSAETSRKVHL